MEKLNIYKQAKNMEKANCDLTDIEFFVTLADYKKLEQQLQAYKDKEEKLREYIKQNILWLDSIDNQVYTICGYNSDRIAIVEVDELLQILNEGSDK